jgi:ribonuclease T1
LVARVGAVKDRRAALGLVVAVVAALFLWWSQGDGSTRSDEASAEPTVAVSDQGEYAAGGTDPQSGLPFVDDLPQEARNTLKLIDSDGPFPYDEDGSTFMNFEGILPDRSEGYYTEYTVETPGSDDRGARRIVAGQHGDFYYTADHYSSFSRITR